MIKPHKGSLRLWRKHVPSGNFKSFGLGYIICGVFVDHPDFAGETGHTSWVVKHEGNEVETINSRYTLVGEEPVLNP